jgi:hypothetical protein
VCSAIFRGPASEKGERKYSSVAQLVRAIPRLRD